jgi:predicted nucleotide-binding protein
VLTRFSGKSGARLLRATLREQSIVEHHAGVANELARVAKVRRFRSGEQLIAQDASDNAIYFILSGAVDIVIKKRKIAERTARLHVGEMALIDPECRRSATVVANQETVVATVSEPEFACIARRHPNLWRRLALELAHRLRERSKFISAPNSCPVVFIGSSREGLTVATAVQRALTAPDIRVEIWAKGVFRPSRTTIEDLEDQAKRADFAVLVASPDDMVTSRGAGTPAPRDNVLLELGLFMGALTRGRTFLLWPQGKALKLPSDLLGVTTLRYGMASRSSRGRNDVSDACREIQAQIRHAGPR